MSAALDITDRLRDPKYDCAWEAAAEIERLRAALVAAECKLDPADRESNPHDLADFAGGALEIVRAGLEPRP